MLRSARTETVRNGSIRPAPRRLRTWMPIAATPPVVSGVFHWDETRLVIGNSDSATSDGASLVVYAWPGWASVWSGSYSSRLLAGSNEFNLRGSLLNFPSRLRFCTRVLGCGCFCRLSKPDDCSSGHLGRISLTGNCSFGRLKRSSLTASCL